MFSSFLGRLPSPSGRLVAFFLLWKLKFCTTVPQPMAGSAAWIMENMHPCLFAAGYFCWGPCGRRTMQFFSSMICVFLALWWEWINRDLPKISKDAQHFKEEKEVELTCRAKVFQKESEFGFMNKARHKRVVSLFLQGPFHGLSLHSCETFIYFSCGFHFMYICYMNCYMQNIFFN